MENLLLEESNKQSKYFISL